MSRKERGFTLIEIMVVVVIIGLIVGLVIANIGGQDAKARIKITHAMLAEVSQAVDMFKLDFGRYPDKIEDLFQQPAGIEAGKWKAYLRREPLDAWGNKFHYSPQGADGDYDLRSYGMDGREGGDGENADISYKDGLKK